MEVTTTTHVKLGVVVVPAAAAHGGNLGGGSGGGGAELRRLAVGGLDELRAAAVGAVAVAVAVAGLDGDHTAAAEVRLEYLDDE
ncbi:hypothetical protein HK405_002665, partial [Cladochytrium tenue]